MSPNFLTSLANGVIKLTVVNRVCPNLIVAAGIAKLWAIYFLLPQLGLAWVTVTENRAKTINSERHRAHTEAHSCSTREPFSFPVGTQ